MKGNGIHILNEDRRILRSYLLRYQSIKDEEHLKLNSYILHENAWRGIVALLFFIGVEIFRVFDLYRLALYETDFVYYWYFIAASLGIISLVHVLWTFPYRQKKRFHNQILFLFIFAVVILTTQEIFTIARDYTSKENFYCCVIILLAFSLYPKRYRALLYMIPTVVLSVAEKILTGYFGWFYICVCLISFVASSMIFNFSCSSELKKIRVEKDVQNLKQVAYIDTLTQIQNRRGIEDYIDVRLREGYIEGYLYFVDIDNFKNFNDTYGHNTGDEVLRQVANTLHGVALRRNCKVCRYGGEEFLIVMPFPMHAEEAKKIGDEIVSNVSKTEIYDYESKKLLHVTVSVGGSSFACKSLTELEKRINKADEALYRVKKNGKNGFIMSA